MTFTFLILLLLNLYKNSVNNLHFSNVLQYNQDYNGFFLENYFFELCEFPTVKKNDYIINIKSSSECILNNNKNRFIGTCIFEITDNIIISEEDKNTLAVTCTPSAQTNIIVDTKSEPFCKVEKNLLKYLFYLNKQEHKSTEENTCTLDKHFVKTCSLTTKLKNIHFNTDANKKLSIECINDIFISPKILVSCDMNDINTNINVGTINKLKDILEIGTNSLINENTNVTLKYPYVYEENKRQIKIICNAYQEIIPDLTETQIDSLKKVIHCNFPNKFIEENTLKDCVKDEISFILECNFTPKNNATIRYQENTLKCIDGSITTQPISETIETNKCNYPKILPAKYKEKVVFSCMPSEKTDTFSGSCEVTTKETNFKIKNSDNLIENFKDKMIIECEKYKQLPTHIIITSLSESEEVCQKPVVENVSFEDTKELYFPGETLKYNCAQGFHKVDENNNTLTCQQRKEPIGLENACIFEDSGMKTPDPSGQKAHTAAMKKRSIMIIAISVAVFLSAVISVTAVYFLWKKNLFCFKRE